MVVDKHNTASIVCDETLPAASVCVASLDGLHEGYVHEKHVLELPLKLFIALQVWRVYGDGDIEGLHRTTLMAGEVGPSDE